MADVKSTMTQIATAAAVSAAVAAGVIKGTEAPKPAQPVQASVPHQLTPVEKATIREGIKAAIVESMKNQAAASSETK
jgi:negative regulator of sigma E activity